MPEEILIELTPQPQPKPFYKTRKGIIIGVSVLLVVFAAIFSWWLSTGKISSIAARLDTMIYTVGSDFPAKLKSLSVMSGDLVSEGQALAVIEAPEFAGQLQSATNELANLRKMAGLPDSQNSQDSANQIEKEAASKLAQARFEEENLQKIYQDAVTEHVRSQLALRAMNISATPAYQEAKNQEAAMRAKMQAAYENFEKASKFRATLDQALVKIKNAILLAKRGSSLSGKAIANMPVPAAFTGESRLLSSANGSVFRIMGNPGQIIQPGVPIFYILPEGNNAQQGGKWIQAWFAQKDRKNIKPGQPVLIKFPVMDLVLNGKIEAVAENEQMLPDDMFKENEVSSLAKSTINYKKGLYVPVKISLNDPSKLNGMEPGARAECQIQTHYIIGNGWI